MRCASNQDKAPSTSPTSAAPVSMETRGALVTEESTVDIHSPVNALLGAAEELVMDLSSDTFKICILRLGASMAPGETWCR